MVENNKTSQYISVEDYTTIPTDVWVNGKSIRIVELYTKKSEEYFEATCDIKVNNSDDRQIDNTYQEFEDVVFTTFSEDLVNQKATSDVKVKTGTKIYKTVFCNDILLYHGAIAEQVPNQTFFP